MATIIPFRGVRYNPVKVGDVTNVVTPPYDVIDADAQKAYHEKHPNNVIRLELGYKYDDDTEINNRYTRAAETFNVWKVEGVLKHDTKPTLYLYEQEFEVRGEKKIRSGFISGVQVEEYSTGVVLPHEQTLPKHKADRLELMRASLANFSPIFGLYSDPENTIDDALKAAKGGRNADIDVVDNTGVINRLWAIDDESTVQNVLDVMSDKKIFIADGHHRYETALNFAKEKAADGHPEYNYIMMTMVNLYDKGLVVFPTHRLVNNVDDLNLEKMVNDLSEDFEVKTLPAGTVLDDFLTKLEETGQQMPSLGLYGQDKTFYILKLKSFELIKEIGEGSQALKKLDVSVLHNLILEKFMGIGSEQRANESNLTYTRDEDYAIKAVDDGSYQLCFFMNPTKVEEVTQIAEGGEKMPQKSTYFYPKIVTGLVINDFTR